VPDKRISSKIASATAVAESGTNAAPSPGARGVRSTVPGVAAHAEGACIAPDAGRDREREPRARV
jgi:hypothetical protein